METYNVAEFFVMNVFRRKGIGEVAARRLFALFPGQWEIAVMRANLPAIAFWRSVVASVSNGTFEEIERSDVGWDGPVLRFSSACDSCTPSLDRWAAAGVAAKDWSGGTARANIIPILESDSPT